MSRSFTILSILFLCAVLSIVTMNGAEPAGWTIFWGRFHPILVHLPIGFLLVGAIAALPRRKKEKPGSGPLAGNLLLAGSFFAILSVLSGFLLSLPGDYDEELFNAHFYTGISLTAVSIAGSYLYFRSRVKPGRTILLIKNLAMGLIIAGLLLTGHYGGSLTHGGDYITEHMNPAMKKFLWIDDPQKIIPQKITDIDSAVVFRDVIFPLISSKCISCHNSGKKKGRLVLDNEAGFLAGGKSGDCIVPGNPDESELYKRIILPEGEEGSMPPEGKSGLDDDEIELIRRWIADSASFTKTFAAFQWNDSLRTLVIKVRGIKDDGIFGKKIALPDSAALSSLKNSGVYVRNIVAGKPYLDVDFINTNSVSAEQLKLLLRLKEQIVWLKLSGLNISDEAMNTISQMKNISVLRLDKTDIDDEDLQHISKLKNLETLNLYGTSIKGPGLSCLAEIQRLKKLFIGNAPIDSMSVDKLVKSKPSLQITL